MYDIMEYIYCRLNNLFQGLDEANPLQYTVYLSMVKLAGKTDYIHHVNTDMDEVGTMLICQYFSSV